MTSKQLLPGFDMSREELDKLIEEATCDCDASRRIEAMTQEERETFMFPQPAPRKIRPNSSRSA